MSAYEVEGPEIVIIHYENVQSQSAAKLRDYHLAKKIMCFEALTTEDAREVDGCRK